MTLFAVEVRDLKGGTRWTRYVEADDKDNALWTALTAGQAEWEESAL